MQLTQIDRHYDLYITVVLFLTLLISNRCAPVLVFISSFCFDNDDDVVVYFIVRGVRGVRGGERSESRENIEKVNKSRSGDRFFRSSLFGACVFIVLIDSI